MVAQVSEQVKSVEFVPSAYQQAVFTWVETGRGDAIINAVAGSGKSTTLVHAARLIRAERATFCAFNKHIAEALSAKLAGTTMQARTIHSIGNGVLYRALGKTQLENYKYGKLAKQWVEAQRFTLTLQGVKLPAAAAALRKLADLARLTLVDIRDRAALERLGRVYSIEDADAVVGGVAWVVSEGEKLAQYGKVIDFTDMIYLPVKMDLTPDPQDWVFVDECQDLNPAQLELVMRLRAPGGRMLFVGDPQQSIMAFAGADSRSFQKIQARTNALELLLSICYRCPTSHLEQARAIVPHIEARPDAPVGTFETIDQPTFVKMLREGDLVLGRKTAPLVGLCLKLISQRISARVRGRDVGKELAELARNIAENSPGTPYREYGKLLQEYKDAAIDRLAQVEGNEERIQALMDRIEAIDTAFTHFTTCQSADDLAREIEGLFSDERSSIWLSTVHRAKGLENLRVFIINPGDLPLKWKGQTADQAEQEMNLKYVALTRAQDALYIVAEK